MATPQSGSPRPIALCITDLDAGGAERALVQVATRIDRTQWSPTVYCLGPQGVLVEPLQQAGIPVICLNAGSRDLAVVKRLANYLRATRPVLIQSFLFHANIASRLAARLAGVPVVVSGIRVAERQKNWHVRLERLTRSLVTHHVCVSQAVADFATKAMKLRPDTVSVIPNGVDVDAFANAPPADLKRFGIEPNQRVLLFVGRLHPQKGTDVLLKAFSALADLHPDLHLLMVGDGPLRSQGEAWTARHMLTDRIHWAGRQEDVAGLMRSATGLVLPSLWEGMPNVVLEAMAAGLPVVATSVDGTRELVIENETGWPCSPGSVETLTNAIREMLSSPVQASRMADHAQTVCRQRFTLESAARSYQSLWQSLTH